MTEKKETKTLHPRNPHNSRYDFEELIKSTQNLKQYVSKNKYGDLSIDFANPDAVMSLNKALLAHFYNIKHWEIPKGYLCPPIPGRADYIHYIADLLKESNNNQIPLGKQIRGLDIGVGANCIYPIVGNSVYGWDFLGSDIEIESIESANSIINSNENLKNNIKCKQQTNNQNIFENIIEKDDKFDFTLCNPPFHKSKKDAEAGSKRKVQNLSKNKNKKIVLNFAGKNNELWCKGGEIAFIKNMIKESKEKSNNCLWFTTLVSKKENLTFIYKYLEEVKVKDTKTIQMNQGQKITRIVAWTFFSKEEQKNWSKKWK